jgi:HEPN domain-containing protein
MGDSELTLPAEHRTDLLKRGFLPLAIENTRRSLESAQRLLDAGFSSPAFVWAIRSAEIFIREALLFPLEFEATGDVRASFSKVRGFHRSDQWSRSIARIREAYGLRGAHDTALTESGEDLFGAWSRDFVRPRAEVVHGRAEVDEAMARAAIAFTDRIRVWLTARIVGSDEGPLAGTLRNLFEQARAQYEEERARAD